MAKPQFPLQTPPRADKESFNQEQVGARFGLWEVIGPERRYTRGWSGLYVPTRCTGCGSEFWVALSNMRLGKSTGCSACARPRKIPQWLWQRLASAKNRCTNPNDPAWPLYGERGIRFEFEGPTAAGLYLIETYGLQSREMEIDRADNNGHYAPGNLRWATRAENQANRRKTRFVQWDPAEWPYSRNQVSRRLREGMTRAEILADAWTAVAEKRKNWRAIQEKLRSLTS